MKLTIFQAQLEKVSLFSKVSNSSFHSSFRALSVFVILILYATNALWAQPVNDLCTDAISIMAPAAGETMTGSGTTLSATSVDAPPSCGGVDNTSVGGIWYTFEGEESTLYSISTCNATTDFDTEISLHTITGTGSCMSVLACQGGNNDGSGMECAGGGSTLSYFVPPGLVATTYYLYVTGNGTATGNLEISLTNGPPLPIELVSFTGRVAEKSNRLSWQTASELNTEKHIIERSLDGTRNWIEVGSKKAVGFSNDLQDYEFEDLDPPAKGYYRLRSVDFDGKEGYSKVVFLERKSLDVMAFWLTPNPTQDLISIGFNQQNNNTIVFTLLNTQGQVIRQWSSSTKKGKHLEKIDLSDLNRGLYFLNLNNGIESASKRILRL